MSVLSKDLNVSSRESKSNSNINKTSNAIRIETFKRLAALSAPEAPRIAMGITGLIINSITNLSFPWLMGQAIDRAGNGDMTCANNSMICGISADYFWFLLKAAGIFVCGSLASWVRVYCLGTSTDIIAKKLRKMLYNGYLFKKIEHYDAARTGEMISTMEKDVSLASQTLTDKLAAGLRSLNSSINGSILLFSISPKLCFVTLAIVPVVGVGAMSISKYANRCKASLREKEVSLLSYVVERLNCITTVKVNHQENNEIARFSTQTDDVYEIAKKAHFAQGSMMGFIGLATNVSLMSILFVGGNMLSKKDITTGDLTRFAIQSAFVGLGFSGVAAFYRELMESLDGAGRVYAAVDANNKEMDANRALAMTTDSNALVTKTGIDTAADTDTAFTNAVVMKNIDFTYSSRPDQLVLNHLDLEIKTGSFSCIVGPSGVGKSTLFGLLCGLHELQQQQSLVSGGASGGSIIIGGRDIATVDKNWLYHNVSVVEQGGVGLLSGSIYYNIMYGNDEDKKDKEANMDVVRAAAGLALAHEFISSFPDGYETMVSVISSDCLLMPLYLYLFMSQFVAACFLYYVF